MTQFIGGMGPGIYGGAGSEDMRPLDALNEMIANSIDSWIEHGCNKTRQELKIQININTEFISVSDNAQGMDQDELKIGLGMAQATKKDRPCGDELMGMYGYGLKAATANLGDYFEVISKKKDKNICHIIMPIKDMQVTNQWLSDIEEEDYNPKSQINEPNKFLKSTKSTSGTVIYISQLKTPNFNAELIRNDLAISWKYLTKKNKFGPPVKIILNGKALKQPLLGNYKNGGIIPFTEIDIDLPIQWKDSGETKQEVIKGTVWLNYEGGQFGYGGFTLYRNLQMVSYRNGELGDNWVDNESAEIEGYLTVDSITPNQRKDNIDTSTAYYKKLDRTIKTLMKGAKTLVSSQKGGLNGEGYKKTIYLKEGNEALLLEFIAVKWIPYFRDHELTSNEIKIPKELEEEINRLKETSGEPPPGDPPPGDPPPGDPPPGDPPPGEPKEKKFIPTGENSFTFNDKNYTLSILRGKTDGSIYSWRETDGLIDIYVDSNADNVNKELLDILEKVSQETHTGKWDKFSINLIKQNIIYQILLKKSVDSAQAFSYSKMWINNLYKNE
ncbi:MAG: hypothetical protein CBC54_005480 [Rhizobiales bacterium TMED94]|nr:MAG: hypothetical protein CBC54_005480 [Rhizobiales bacterium TMED94]